MDNDKQTGKRKKGRTFTQEMQEVFSAWVRRLPFVKNDLPENAGQAKGEKEPAEHPFAHGR
jgi:hypothetical protein